MTDGQALNILLEMVKANEKNNRDAHESILNAVDGLRTLVTRHCEDQESELAERRQMFESEIATAKQQAIVEMKAPGPFKTAGRIISNRAVRTLTVAGSFLGVVSLIIVIVERFS